MERVLIAIIHSRGAGWPLEATRSLLSDAEGTARLLPPEHREEFLSDPHTALWTALSLLEHEQSTERVYFENGARIYEGKRYGV